MPFVWVQNIAVDALIDSADLVEIRTNVDWVEDNKCAAHDTGYNVTNHVPVDNGDDLPVNVGDDGTYDNNDDSGYDGTYKSGMNSGADGDVWNSVDGVVT